MLLNVVFSDENFYKYKPAQQKQSARAAKSC